MSLKSRVVKVFESFGPERGYSTNREALSPTAPNADPDEHLWQPFSVRGGMNRTRGLPNLTHRQMIDYAHYFFKGNPLAKRIIELTAEYVVGDGIQYVAEDEAVQRVLDAHWTNPVNNWTLAQFERARDFGLVGELCIPAYVNSINGSVELGHIDTGVVTGIVSNRENALRNEAVILNKLRGESYHRAYKIISPANVPLGQPASGRLVGLPMNDEEKVEFGFDFKIGDTFKPTQLKSEITAQWAGSCFYFTVNNPLSSPRGWSDLLHDMDWIDAHDQYLFSQVEKAIQSANYIWDVTLENMNQQQINEWVAAQPPVKPGQLNAHNQSVKREVLAPNLHLEDAATLAGALKNHILAGAGHPPIWFAESSSSRASAPEMTEPAFKHLKLRQRYVANYKIQIFRFVIDQAILKGRLKQDSRRNSDTQAGIESGAFYLRMPDISAKDQRMLSVAMRNLSEALAKAVEMEFLTSEEAKRLFNQYLDMSGLDSYRDEPRYRRGLDTIPDDRFDENKLFERVTKSESQVTMKGNTYYFAPDLPTPYGSKRREEAVRDRHLNGRATYEGQDFTNGDKSKSEKEFLVSLDNLIGLVKASGGSRGSGSEGEQESTGIADAMQVLRDQIVEEEEGAKKVK